MFGLEHETQAPPTSLEHYRFQTAAETSEREPSHEANSRIYEDTVVYHTVAGVPPDSEDALLISSAVRQQWTREADSRNEDAPGRRADEIRARRAQE